MKLTSIYHLLSIIMICCAMSKATGQVPLLDKKLFWQAEEAADKIGERVEGKFLMIVNGREGIELRRNQEPPLYFTVESVEGQWHDEKVDGSIRYHVHFRNEVRGTISIDRSSGNAVVHIDFSRSGEHALDLKLKVSAVNQEN